jgi:hypothetical protein
MVVAERVGAAPALHKAMVLLPNERFQKLPFDGAASLSYINPILKVVAVAVKANVFSDQAVEDPPVKG